MPFDPTWLPFESAHSHPHCRNHRSHHSPHIPFHASCFPKSAGSIATLRPNRSFEPLQVVQPPHSLTSSHASASHSHPHVCMCCSSLVVLCVFWHLQHPSMSPRSLNYSTHHAAAVVPHPRTSKSTGRHGRTRVAQLPIHLPLTPNTSSTRSTNRFPSSLAARVRTGTARIRCQNGRSVAGSRDPAFV